MQLLKLLFASGPKYNWKKVVFLLTLSSFAISGSVGAGYLFYRYTKHSQASYAPGIIQAIVHTTPQTGGEHVSLQAAYLAEILGLSEDKPTSLGEFDLKDAKRRILSTHVIRKTRLKKMKPNLLFVQYTMRTPVALLEDYTNTAVDPEGVLFPYAPFYSARNFPKIYLGDKRPSEPWGAILDKILLNCAQDIFLTLGYESIDRIDLSTLDDPSSGRRSIVIQLKDGSLLRLHPKDYDKQLANYLILKQNVLKGKKCSIIDMRIPEVAYLQME